MEPFLFFMSLMGCFAIYRWGRALQRLTETKPLAMREEESADDIIKRHRASRAERRAKDKALWDEMYFRSLPVQEHPDYFELDLDTDEVEVIVTKSFTGDTVSRHETRINSRGVPYTIVPDYVSGIARVDTGEISWEVTLSSIDKKQLERR